MKRRPLLITDADNTLWDTDAVFAKAQVQLLRDLEEGVGCEPHPAPLDFVREIDQRIAQSHEAGLRYPPEMLIKALLASPWFETASPVAPRVEPDRDAIVARYTELLFGTLPDLRPGVRAGLSALRHAGVRIVVMTESSERSCLARLEKHRLSEFVHEIKHVRKSPDEFREIARLQTGGGHPVFAVGDQLDRDIKYAQEAGFYGIFFPGGFVPVWMPSVEVVRPDATIASYAELPAVIADVLTLR